MIIVYHLNWIDKKKKKKDFVIESIHILTF